MSLTKYNKKRDFTKTKEPKGKVKNEGENRFVIQYHQARAKHYDFRLEHNGALISWAIPKGLSPDPKDKRLAVKVEDHPVDYMDFEGVIPKGNYGAGTVEIYDKGYYLPIKDLDAGLKKGHIKVLLKGEKLIGAWSLIKIEDDNWLAVKIDDGYAETNENVKNTKREKLPFNTCSVMLATLSDKIPKGKEWIGEIKYDGYRILAFEEGEKIKLLSRNGNDYTQKFKSIAKELNKIDGAFVLDGEVVCFDADGRSDFGLLQQNIRSKKSDFYYVVFDLLAQESEDLRGFPLIKRKQKAEILLHEKSPRLIYSSHVDDLKQCFDFAKEKNLEGIIVKKSNSPYRAGRSNDWLKIKNGKRQEFVIAGFATTVENEFLSAILVGYYDKNKLVFAGKVGTGFNENNRKILRKTFDKLTVKDCPFSENVKEKAVWIKPELVAEIKFAEFTKDGRLRQPSFVGLREDKKASEVKKEDARRD